MTPEEELYKLLSKAPEPRKYNLVLNQEQMAIFDKAIEDWIKGKVKYYGKSSNKKVKDG